MDGTMQTLSQSGLRHISGGVNPTIPLVDALTSGLSYLAVQSLPGRSLCWHTGAAVPGPSVTGATVAVLGCQLVTHKVLPSGTHWAIGEAARSLCGATVGMVEGLAKEGICAFAIPDDVWELYYY